MDKDSKDEDLNIPRAAINKFVKDVIPDVGVSTETRVVSDKLSCHDYTEAGEVIDAGREEHQKATITHKVHTRHPLKLVAVHLGAGNTKDGTKSLEFAQMICEEVMLLQRQQNSAQGDTNQLNDSSDTCPECKKFTPVENAAEMAVVQLIQRMEDNQDLNCAFGSNLNIQGQVECDAGFMSGRTRAWCGVGAVSGCRNPISLVKSIHDHQSLSRPLGLVQPNFLVGSGAKQWMREHCPHLIVANSRLISSKSFSQYQKLKSRYDSCLRSSSATSVETAQDEPETVSFDTVGAIAVDCDYNLVSAVSSGGLLLKCRGRVGQAAVPGAGCWTESRVCATTTGVGEYLTGTLFAREIVDRLKSYREVFVGCDSPDEPERLITDRLRSCFETLRDANNLAQVPVKDRLAGVLAVSASTGRGSPPVDETKLYLSYGHNTKTMCIGYMTCNDVAGHSIMSRLAAEKTPDDIVAQTIKLPFG